MPLAARALGLGATLTTLYLSFEKEAEASLGLPAGVHSYALLPIGYPMGRFGPVRRVALSVVLYEDRWGNFSEIRDEPLKLLKSDQNPGRGHCISDFFENSDFNLTLSQTLSTSTRNGCSSIFASNMTSHCFCSAISKV
jgi:hypothetical protein